MIPVVFLFWFTWDVILNGSSGIHTQIRCGGPLSAVLHTTLGLDMQMSGAGGRSEQCGSVWVSVGVRLHGAAPAACRKNNELL